jgi:hypothetical protein
MKAGLAQNPPPSGQYIFTNNISVYNKSGGMRDNSNGMPAHIDSRWYNNVMAFNFSYGFSSSIGSGDMATNVLRNNLLYSNAALYYFESIAIWTHDHNSFDASPTVTVTADDFVSVDSTGITEARQADGSLPDNDCYNNFMHLASTSDLINAGIDVGLTYEGAAPDIGAFEYTDPGVDVEPLVMFTTSVYPTKITASVNANVYDDGGGTVSARGVCWSVGANPDLADNVVTVAGTLGIYTATITGLTSGATYHVRAYATNEIGTSYSADLQFTTTVTSFVKNGIRWVFTGNKWIKI